MSQSAQELSKQDFFHGYLAEYLDGELPPDLAARFDTLLKAPGNERTPEQFQALRGRLQLTMQGLKLTEAELVSLRSLVQDPRHAASGEATQIEEIGRREVLGGLARRVALVAAVAGIVAVLVWKLAPSRESTFKPLEYLGYEALALEEDAQDRLNLPSKDIKEIRQYLASYPGLAFAPKVLKTMPRAWQPEGATVIDYEVAKVALVEYANDDTKEKLFHFSYAGELSDLPKAEAGNMRGLIFHTYSSDELNLIAWQASPGVVSIIAGRRSAPELAEIAVDGSGKN